jgi:hypothetical protein
MTERPYSALPLRVVLRYLDLMEARGVSEIARSPRGFVAAYRRAGGDLSRLTSDWIRRRQGFVARHMAQVLYREEPLFEEGGDPTRRHLALIAWAYSPEPSRLSKVRGRRRS